MGFLDKLLGREKDEPEGMPADPQMRSEGTQPETSGMAEAPPAAPAPPADMPQDPGMEGTSPPPERDQP